MKHRVEEVVLKNGSRGLLIDVDGASVMSYQFHFRAGNRYTRSHEVYETAHVMEHMAFGANSKFPDSQQCEAEYTKNGAYRNAYTSDHSMVYYGDCADFEWDRILELKQLAICSPRFNDEEFVAEIGNVKSELNGYLNKHAQLLWPKIQQNLGEDVLTFPERIKTISNIKLSDICEHYTRTHTHENMRFVIAGCLGGRKTKLINMLESWELNHGERMSIPVDELHRQEPLLIRRKEATNLTFGWSLNVPRRLSDIEIDAMACANHILTGTMHSRIFGTARSKGLAYNIFSDTSASEHTSSWDFGAEVNGDAAGQVFDIITREVRNILEGNVSRDEVEAAKQYALGRHQMGAQTVGQINRWYATKYFFDGTVDDYEARPAAIQSVESSRVVETAREFINANCWMLGVLGTTEKAFVEELNNKLVPVFE
jgi:predicted Zn-dependent peptidase